MTPKEKAIELYSRYYNRIEHSLSEEYSPHEKDIVKQCAMVAVDEILAQNISTPDDYGASWTYWMQVKQEIEKL